MRDALGGGGQWLQSRLSMTDVFSAKTRVSLSTARWNGQYKRDLLGLGRALSIHCILAYRESVAYSSSILWLPSPATSRIAFESSIWLKENLWRTFRFFDWLGLPQKIRTEPTLRSLRFASACAVTTPRKSHHLRSRSFGVTPTPTARLIFSRSP